MHWLDRSDGKTRFFVAECDELLDFILQRLLRLEKHNVFDTLFVEVNCDTGMIITSPSTEAARSCGLLHGCAVRLSKLQDVWYDLDQSGVSGEEFHIGVEEQVRRIGLLFEAGLPTRFDEFSASSRNGTIDLVVFGNDPGKVILRKRMPTLNGAV